MISRKEFIAKIAAIAPLTIAAFPSRKPSSSLPNIIPKGLKTTNNLGLVAPAGRIYRDEEYHNIINNLSQLGFNVIEGNHTRSAYGYMAGRDSERVEDFHSMILNPKINIIMALRGGWGSNRLLPYIDFEAIKKNPKIIIGFSDITSLLLSIYSQTGLVTFHGPVARSVWTSNTKKWFFNVLSTPPLKKLILQPSSVSKTNSHQFTIYHGKAEGRLLGGNLSILVSMLASPYLPLFDNSVLFIEEVGEEYYRIDRMLSSLKLSGILSRIKGFIFGYCTSCNPSLNSDNLSLKQIVLDYISDLRIPSWVGFPIGHENDNLTLPIGNKVQIDSSMRTITLLEPAVI